MRRLTTKSQEKVWEKVAKNWKEYRQVPGPTTVDFLKNKKGNILDVGSGSGRNLIKIDAVFHAVDFSTQMLKYAEKKAKKANIKIKTFKANADKLPFEDNFFDSAICIALLHCIPEKQKRENTIKEIFRTLKPGSEALISVWGRKSPRLKNKDKECLIPWTIQNREEGKHKEERYTYIYDKEELENEVRQAGFKILQSWEERNINVIAKKA